MTAKPYWTKSGPLPHFAPLDHSLETDVVVVGGGITGITAAYLLKQAGASVALLERGRCAAADTGHTTAHLSMVTDLRLPTLVRRFGEPAARGVWDAGNDAIEQIAELIEAEEIACEFIRVPGYLHAPVSRRTGPGTEEFAEDVAAARRLGFSAELLREVPGVGRPGVRYENQAKLDPRKYLAGLLKSLPGKGTQVFEHSEVAAFEEDPLAVRVGRHRVRCRFLVVATHNPLAGNASLLSALGLQTRLALYTSYVLGARLPQGTLDEALYWDTSDPYFYLRIDRPHGHDYAIFGGLDCKTGQEPDAAARFRELHAELRRRLPAARVDRHWLGQVIETVDGLPYIGETAERQFVATGFAGNGMTFGTLGAMMARDRFLGLENPWADLFDVQRRKLSAGTWKFVRENLDFPYHFVRDRLAGVESTSADAVPAGEGRILRMDGRKVAAYRDPSGQLTLLSPVCTHLKCLVRWNNADATWDCPCHGSRFKPTGEVLAGPAEQALEQLEPAEVPAG